MSLSTVAPRNDYLGDGTQDTYGYDFRIFEATDLRVLTVDPAGVQTLLTYLTDYTVTGVNDPNGGSIVLTAGVLANGTALTIRFFRALQQNTDLRNQRAFYPEVHEDKFDELVRFLQQLNDALDRSFKLPETELGSELNTLLPSLASRVGAYLGFDSSGNPAAFAPPVGTAAISAFIQTILDDVNAAAARQTLGAAAVDSQVFTGTPQLPVGTTGVKANPGDNDDSLATTGFVQQERLSNNAAQDALHPRVPIRQTVIAGSVDANGAANWLVIGAGLTIDYNATTTPVLLVFANGYDATGEVDAAARLTVNAQNQFGILPASVTSFLYADRLSASTIQGANTQIPPQYGDLYDPKQNVLLHFNGADAAATTTDDYGNTWTLVANAQLDTAQFKFGTASLLLDGTGDYAECAPALPFTFTQQGYGWTIEGHVRFAVLPTAAQHMVLFNLGQSATNFGVLLSLFNNAGTTKLELSLSSNGTSHDVTSATVGTNTTWAANTWYHVALVFDPLAGKYYLYLNGGQDLSVTSTLNVAQLIKARLGETLDATLVQLNGWMDEVRFSPCVRYPGGATFVVAAAAFVPEGQWFSIPLMQMFEVTAASGVAGVNPTLTNRAARLFVGEADAGAATISAVRSYAYRGRYTSIDTAFPAGGTRITFPSNLGFTPDNIQIALRNYTGELGYAPGMVVSQILESRSGGTYFTPVVLTAESRTLLSYTYTSVANVALPNRTTGVFTATTEARWKLVVSSRRSW